MTAPNTSVGRPTIPPVIPEPIPEVLKNVDRWVAWRAGKFKPTGKFGKFPVDPVSRRALNPLAPTNWLSFERAMDAHRRGVADGVGFVLSDRFPVVTGDNPLYLTAIDLDHCAPKMPEHQALWQELAKPYVEISPSGKGLRMLGLTSTPLKGGNAGDGRELYSSGRFMTITGVTARGTLFENSVGLAAVEQRWFPAVAAEAHGPPLPSVIDSATPLDNRVLRPMGDNWYERLSPEGKQACLSDLLQDPAVIALADTHDETPAPNWRTVLAACVRSGAPDAYSLCLAWAQTSQRFDPGDFDARWRSYARG